MALSEDQIIDLFNDACRETFNGLERFRYFARAIEDEVREECAAELAALRTERDHMEMAADAEARRVDELTALRKQDDALIQQLVEALEASSPHTDREYRWKPEDWAKRRIIAITAGHARLEGKQ